MKKPPPKCSLAHGFALAMSCHVRPLDSILDPFRKAKGPVSRGLLSRPYLVNCSASGGDPEVVAALQADPELSGVTEVATEAEGGVGGDAALAAHQIVYPRSGDVKFLGEAVGGQAERLHEFGEENFAGMNREGEGDFIHGSS